MFMRCMFRPRRAIFRQHTFLRNPVHCAHVLILLHYRQKNTKVILQCNRMLKYNTVKPVLSGISRAQNIFPLKPGFRLIEVYYDSHGT
jgi:hypothetical protein